MLPLLRRGVRRLRVAALHAPMAVWRLACCHAQLALGLLPRQGPPLRSRAAFVTAAPDGPGAWLAAAAATHSVPRRKLRHGLALMPLLRCGVARRLGARLAAAPLTHTTLWRPLRLCLARHRAREVCGTVVPAAREVGARLAAAPLLVEPALGLSYDCSTRVPTCSEQICTC